MGANGVELSEEQIEKIGKLDSDVKNLQSSFEGFVKRFESNIKLLFDELKQHQKETAPKPISFPVLLSMGVSLIAILGGMFATVIYIANSSNAPIMAQQNQMLNTMNTIVSNQTRLSSDIQLANKDISVIKGKSVANEETLQWIIFTENLPKQITQMQKDIEYMKLRGK